VGYPTIDDHGLVADIQRSTRVAVDGATLIAAAVNLDRQLDEADGR
jgi:hypothetical protein